MRTLALIARRPDLERSHFRKHYEEVHVPLALPLLEGITRYVRNHLVSAIGEEDPPFDVLTEFSYRDRPALDAVVEKLALPEGAGVARDELTFMDKPKNVFFGVEALGGSEIEGSAGLEKLAILGRRGPEETRDGFRAKFVPALGEVLAGAIAWKLWGTRSLFTEAPFDVVSFAWFESGSLDESRIESWHSTASQLWKLRVDECRTEIARPGDESRRGLVRDR